MSSCITDGTRSCRPERLAYDDITVKSDRQNGPYGSGGGIESNGDSRKEITNSSQKFLISIDRRLMVRRTTQYKAK